MVKSTYERFYEEVLMKRFLMFYSMIILVTVLAGCGKSPDSDVQSSENKQTVALKSEEAVTVTIPEFPFKLNTAVMIDQGISRHSHTSMLLKKREQGQTKNSFSDTFRSNRRICSALPEVVHTKPGDCSAISMFPDISAVCG
jgi:hypothetical protein